MGVVLMRALQCTVHVKAPNFGNSHKDQATILDQGNSRVPLKGFGVTQGRFRVVVNDHISH